MVIFRTAEVARKIGIHPNTVRLYEKLGLIPQAERRLNGYRIFTDFHLDQLRLARIALNVEILQNGLRQKAIDIIKASASGDFEGALHLADRYQQQLRVEQKNADDAIIITRQLLSGVRHGISSVCLTRRKTADLLGITIDTLRNWEMNGLLTVKRLQNGYRVYTEDDICRLKIIRSLRCANYSISSILRMLSALSADPAVDIREVINTPTETDDIISICDRLLTSLRKAEHNADVMLQKLMDMRKCYNTNPPF